MSDDWDGQKIDGITIKGVGDRIDTSPTAWDNYEDSDEDDEPDPTHECMNCRTYRAHIEEPAGKHESYWCDWCGDLKQFERL
jgi:hypothetical protein